MDKTDVQIIVERGAADAWTSGDLAGCDGRSSGHAVDRRGAEGREGVVGEVPRVKIEGDRAAENPRAFRVTTLSLMECSGSRFDCFAGEGPVEGSSARNTEGLRDGSHPEGSAWDPGGCQTRPHSEDVRPHHAQARSEHSGGHTSWAHPIYIRKRN